MFGVSQSESLTTRLGLTVDEIFDRLTEDEQINLYAILQMEFDPADEESDHCETCNKLNKLVMRLQQMSPEELDQLKSYLETNNPKS